MPINLPFSREEYDDRLRRTRAAMAEAGIEVLFTCDPSNMAWLTGYDGWSFYVHQGVLVGPDGDPVFWGRGMDAAGARRTVWMGADDIVGYDDDLVMNPPAHAMTDLASLIRLRGWADKALGVETENYYYTARAHAVLSAELGETTDATGLVNWCRAVKSAAEIGYMRRAAAIVSQMHADILKVVRPGVRKNDVAAEIFASGLRGTTEFGGDYPAIVPLMPSGEDASAAHLTWDDRPFEPGTATFFEIAGCYRRYHVPCCRTVHLGPPPRDLLAAEAAVIEGIEAGIAAASAGNVAGDVARAFHQVLARHGIERKGRCGYPIGLSYPPDWGERTYSIRESDQTVLQSGMTFHFMTGLWQSNWGLELTETLLIRDSGPAECLTDVPRRLEVI